MIRASKMTLPLALLLGSACGDDAKVTPVSTMDAGESVSVALAPPTSADAGLAFTPTWHEHIAPLVHEHCSGCHQPGAIAPFSMLEYGTTKGFAGLMASEVESGAMPPYLATNTADCTPKHKYAEDTRLSDQQKQMLRAWATAGAPEGDPAKAAPLPNPPPVALDREDVVMTIPQPIVTQVSDKGDLHTCLVIDPKLDKDVYITGRQITAGNPKVLHHVVQYVVKPALADGTATTRADMLDKLRATKGVGIGERYDCFGGPTLDQTGLAYEMLGAWAPGALPVTGPDDSGQPAKRDSLIVLDMHYHPLASGPETDSTTKLSLRLATSIPKYIAAPVFQGYASAKQPVHQESAHGTADLLLQPGETTPALFIPAGEANHVEEWTYKWKLPVSSLRVYFASTHMHYVGRDMQVQLINGTPKAGEDPVECLLETPKWDFNWQRGYTWEAKYDQLPQLDDGDTIKVKCVFDNTLDNKFLAKALDEQGKSAPIDVSVGEDTLNEMCLATIGIAYPNAAYVPPTTP
ncbi:MAG: hypothetical protein JWN04_4310 [Myxococcaceae bacterium]|nr:hypothetical protein [Myxococcaceae bacterium]